MNESIAHDSSSITVAEASKNNVGIVLLSGGLHGRWRRPAPVLFSFIGCFTSSQNSPMRMLLMCKRTCMKVGVFWNALCEINSGTSGFCLLFVASTTY